MFNQISGLLGSHCTGNTSCPLCSHPYFPSPRFGVGYSVQDQLNSNQSMNQSQSGYAALQNKAFMSIERLRGLGNAFSGQINQSKLNDFSLIDDVYGQISKIHASQYSSSNRKA